MPSATLPVHILVVEDNAAFAEMLLTGLRLRGIPADHASTVDEADAFLDTIQPDLILLDLNLCGTSGWQVLEFVKQKYGEYGIPVIVSSAYKDIANRTIGRLHSISHYLVKPFTPRELYRAIDDVLELYKMGV